MTGTGPTEERWPRPVLAAPRSPRELAWHAALLAGTLTLLLPAGWYLLLCVILLARVLRPDPKVLLQIAATYIGLAALFLTARHGLGGYPQTLHTFLAHRIPDHISILQFMGWSLLGLPFPTLTYALYQAYDRRTVTRGTVDDRVWRRQQDRHLQLARAQHRHQPPPLLG
jgi:hypothetical protein